MMPIVLPAAHDGLAELNNQRSMTARSDDPDFSGAGQRTQWDAVAPGWATWWQTIERGAQSVSQRMVDFAEVVPGQRVLDIATGIGEPALLAARRVGPSGRVVATDLSAAMLALASRRAAGMEIRNVDFLEVDAGHLPFPPSSFDAVLCRWGITSLPRHAEILTDIRRLLRPHGIFVTAVWEEDPKSRPLATLATAVLHEIVAPSSPLPHTQPGPGSVAAALRADMLHAGFRHIHTENVALTLEFASTEDCTSYLRDVSPDLTTALSTLSSTQLALFNTRLAQHLQPFRRTGGTVVISNITLCVAGKP